MKTIRLCVLLLLALPLAAADLQTPTVTAEKDRLLTADGTLFIVERITTPSADGESLPVHHLRFKAQQGETVKTSVVPTTDRGGVPSNPSLAYDPVSKTLFLFWQKQPNHLSSELLLCSYRNGEWGPVDSIENSIFHLRSNLKIGVTRFADQEQSEKDKPAVVRTGALSVHAIWWDIDAYGESARYAMVSFERGKMVSIEIRSLVEFVGQTDDPVTLPSENRDFLRHPAIFESPAQDAVDIIFTDWNKNRIHRVNVRPTIKENGLIRLPVGKHRRTVDVPSRFDAPGKVTIVSGATPGNLLFYSSSDKGIRWISHTDAGWSEPQTFKLSDGLSADQGAELLRKMIAAEITSEEK